MSFGVDIILGLKALEAKVMKFKKTLQRFDRQIYGADQIFRSVSLKGKV